MAKNFRGLAAKIPYDAASDLELAEEREAVEDALALGRVRDECDGAAGDRHQGTSTRLEHNENVYLATLWGYVALLGGELELTAVFPDGRVVLSPKVENSRGQ